MLPNHVKAGLDHVESWLKARSNRQLQAALYPPAPEAGTASKLTILVRCALPYQFLHHSQRAMQDVMRLFLSVERQGDVCILKVWVKPGDAIPALVLNEIRYSVAYADVRHEQVHGFLQRAREVMHQWRQLFGGPYAPLELRRSPSFPASSPDAAPRGVAISESGL